MTWFQQAELVHCRTAMAAVAGIIIPGVCASISVLNLQSSCADYTLGSMESAIATKFMQLRCSF